MSLTNFVDDLAGSTTAPKDSGFEIVDKGHTWDCLCAAAMKGFDM